MRKTSKKGFTLVEVMVTVALLSAVGVLCASLIFMSINHSRQNAQKSAFQIGVNKFVAIMNNCINSGGDGTVDVVIKDSSSGFSGAKTGSKELQIKVNSTTETYEYDYDTKTITLKNGTGEVVISPYVGDAIFTYDEDKHLLNVRVQSDLDGGWLATSFYIRQVMSDEKSAS